MPRSVVRAAAVFLACLATTGAAQTIAPTPLRILRQTPGAEASPMATISVVFDRPVAGSLDRIVDASTVMHIEPAIAGKLEWRDPVTIQFIPARALATGESYTVTIANTFRAMDGSALEAPKVFSFRVQWPRLLAGWPVDSANRADDIRLDRPFRVVYSAAVDTAMLSRAATLEFASCSGSARVIRLRVTQRRLTRSESPLDYAGGWRRNPSVDSLRRLVVLTPESVLPHDCAGELVLPVEADPQASRGYVRWPFRTYADFRLLGLDCNGATYCPTGPLVAHFSTPVKGAEVLRHVHLNPGLRFTVDDTASVSKTWSLDTVFARRTAYTVTVDPELRDDFGQGLTGPPASTYRTTSFAPGIEYPYGNLLVERAGFRTLSVHHVNVDTLVVSIAPVPDSLEARVLERFGWHDDSVLTQVARGAVERRIPTHGVLDRLGVTAVPIEAPDATRAGSPTLFVVRIKGRVKGNPDDVAASQPVALLQVTDLGVHARISASQGTVWVTSANDGSAKPGATVVLYDRKGRALAAGATDLRGLARLTGWAPLVRRPGDTTSNADHFDEGYVKVTAGKDRAVASFNTYDSDLDAWRFGVDEAWGDDRYPVAGAVFAERGIYRPGERVYAKAVVRDGLLGSLRAPAGDSIKWLFHDRDEGMLRETVGKLSAFGTADASIVLPDGAPLGHYWIEVKSFRLGSWHTVGIANYRVAEYRPPEFLVTLAGDNATRFPGDTLLPRVSARYLFGAPMGRAVVNWSARVRAMYPWELEIKGVEDWYVGSNAGIDWRRNDENEVASGTDTLDVRGERLLKVGVPKVPVAGRPAQLSIETAVTDINRQVVGSAVTVVIHPADFYIAARPVGTDYFWKAGAPQRVSMLVVRPSGDTVSGIAVHGIVVRREWHAVRRERDGVPETVSEWVADSVATCDLTSARAPVECTFTPKSGGSYQVIFTAVDRAGREVTTSFGRWASGSDWVPWDDESQFKMDVIADKERYSVGDTATVLFASPFTNAEAWITVEREGIIEQRRVKITSGSTTLRFPITEAYAPNAFISILVARGRSAPPSRLDDPGRPTIRVGYASLRVTPEVKRLTVTATPEKNEYRPADSARVRLTVRNVSGRGERSEVTLWAVDEGVLSLTGYRTPDPLDLIYRARGLGVRLRSNLSKVAPQVPEGTKGSRDPGGGGGSAGADVLRSRFQTTAFFLGSVVTDLAGNATVTAKLPDNITTFRVMAVAVTTGDRYGSGESPMLVTRPLLARQALPRFVRPGDDFTAGAVINRRDGAAQTVNVRATASGVQLNGSAEKTATLEASRGVEVRFPFKALRTDAATFRFDVMGTADTDAVRVTLPVRPDYHPRAYTVAGTLTDSARSEVVLPANIDPDRSRLTLTLGASPLAMIRGMNARIRVYPYYCTEQVASAATALIPLYRVQKETGVATVGATARPDIQAAVTMLSRRQRDDGGIGYWSNTDWTSGWLSAYAGITLLDARDAGIPVDTLVLQRLGEYLRNALHSTLADEASPVSPWARQRKVQLGDQVAAADYLSRLGQPDIAAENDLVRAVSLMSMEDRARLSEVVMRRRQVATARRIMQPTWAQVKVDGRRATLPDSIGTPLYFTSEVRPIARILRATLAVDSSSALIAPLMETLVGMTRDRRSGWAWEWNTQDYGAAVAALAAVDRAMRAQPPRTVRLRANGRVVIAATRANRAGRDSSVALTGLLTPGTNEQRLSVSLDAGVGTGAVYYYLSVTEVPLTQPVTPSDNGIQVERWYEPFAGGNPISSVTEGDIVRVRLRITVPTARQFVVLDDALPAGLEAIDLSLRTASALAGPGSVQPQQVEGEGREGSGQLMSWMYGSWDSGWWSPFDHRELRDDRVVYAATVLFPGTYTATYVARATTPGTFIRPPAHAEEMYNPAVNGRSDGGTFVVRQRPR